MQLPPLHDLLQQSTWRRLLAIAESHQLPASTRQRKATLVDMLQHHLQSQAVLHAILPQLDASATAALMALVDAKGSLPAYPFQQRFGRIRDYRPWSDEHKEEAKPWLTPAGATERLLYLGLVYCGPRRPQPGHVEQITLPAELLDPLRRALNQDSSTTPHTPQERPGKPAGLTLHLGLWLSAIADGAVRTRHQRWLLPTLLDRLIRRLRLDEITPCRSERHVPYLAFLHQLAHRAEFVEHGETLRLTPLAWRWLAAGPAMRLQSLWNAFAQPREMDPSFEMRWHTPGEALTHHGVARVVDTLREQPVESWFPLVALDGESAVAPTLLEQLRLHDVWGILPSRRFSDDPQVHPMLDNDPLLDFFSGPLFWFGLLDLDSRQEHSGTPARDALYAKVTTLGAWLLALPGHGPPPDPPAKLCRTVGRGSRLFKQINAQIDDDGEGDLIIAEAGTSPECMARLTRYCKWLDEAELPPGLYAMRLAPQRIAQAASAGVDVNEICQDIAFALTPGLSGEGVQGATLSRRLRQRIRKWAAQGTRVRIHNLAVLETDDEALMRRLRRRKLIRRHLGTPIGPRRATINPDDAGALVKRLAGEGLAVTPRLGTGERKQKSGGAMSGGSALSEAESYFLVELYRGLGEYVDLPVKISWEARQALSAALSDAQCTAAEEHVAAIVEQIRRGLNGYLALPPWKSAPSAESDPRAIKRVLEGAIEQGRRVRIVYWSADSSRPLEREVTPYTIQENSRVDYLHAYCHLREEERVFRVDRIEHCESLGPRASGPSDAA